MEHFALDGYDVKELLGFGSSGEVWRAVETRSGDVVALKRLPGSFEMMLGDPAAGRSEAVEALRREAALLASVRHEHLIRLRSVVPTAAGLILVLEFAEGGSLAALLASRGRLTPGEVVTIGAPLAQALAEVHDRGLLHGDITPANVLFTAAGKPLIADLGVSSLAAEDAEIVGRTPGFADPAASDGAAASSSARRASDVYGLAAVCYAALAGRAPHQDGEPVRPPLASVAPAAPSALVAAIETALAAEPRSRPSAAAFGRALFAACAPEPVQLVEGGTVVLAEPELTNRLTARGSVGVGGAGAGANVPGSGARGKGAPGRGMPGRGMPGRGTPGRGMPDGAAAATAALTRLRWGPFRRRLVVAGIAAGLVGAAVVGGVAWAARGSGALAGRIDPAAAAAPATPVAAQATPVPATAQATPVTPTPPARVLAPVTAAAPGTATVTAANWETVVATLDTRRDDAFTDLDVGALDAVYTPSAPGLVADRARMAQLVAAGAHAEGLTMHLLSVTAGPVASGSAGSSRAGSSSVRLVVDDVLPAYRIVGPTGSVQQVAGRPERRWIVVVTSQTPGAGWRIASVVAA